MDMINPELMKLLESPDILDALIDSVTYQQQKLNSVENTEEGREWYRNLPLIVKEKFDNYKKDYDHLSQILNLENEQLKMEMKKGYYFWRLLQSACNNFKNDLEDYDQQLYHEFSFKQTPAISNNLILKNCIEVLDKHVIEN